MPSSASPCVIVAADSATERKADAPPVRDCRERRASTGPWAPRLEHSGADCPLSWSRTSRTEHSNRPVLRQPVLATRAGRNCQPARRAMRRSPIAREISGPTGCSLRRDPIPPSPASQAAATGRAGAARFVDTVTTSAIGRSRTPTTRRRSGSPMAPPDARRGGSARPVWQHSSRRRPR